jgi:hypothetical protein
MTVKIYEDKAFSPDKLIGRIEEDGKVYSIESGTSDYLGYIDYEQGEVYNDAELLLGWAEDDGTVIAYYEEDEEEEEIGYINDQGEVFFFDSNEEEVYFGSLQDWNEYSEGAAVLLFFTEED